MPVRKFIIPVYPSLKGAGTINSLLLGRGKRIDTQYTFLQSGILPDKQLKNYQNVFKKQ